jgi:hypothetical protein
LNLFNRVVLAFVLLVLAAGAIAIIVLTWTIPKDSISGLRDAVSWLDDNNQDAQKAVLTSIAGLVALVSLCLLLLEVLPASGPDVKVTDVKVGDAVLSTAAIGQRVEEAVRQVSHVAEVKAAVRQKGKGVLVSLDLHVDPDANLATVADESCQAARDVLAEKVHVAIAGPPLARLHYRELRLQRAAAARSVPPARPAPPPAAPAASPGEAEAAAPSLPTEPSPTDAGAAPPTA